jgi:hypothetical protein
VSVCGSSATFGVLSCMVAQIIVPSEASELGFCCDTRNCL